MDEVPLSEIADLQVGFPFKSAEFSSELHHPRLLRGDNIGQGDLRWNGAARWGENSVATQYELLPGDVVVAMDRPWIEAGLKYASVSEHDVPSYLVQRVARLRAKPGNDQRFLHYLIASAAFTSHVLSVQTGTAVPHISGPQILAFRLRQRTLAEQRAIAVVLGALDDKIAANERVVQASTSLAEALVRAVSDRAPLADLAFQSTRSLRPSEFVAGVHHYSLPAFDAGRGPERPSSVDVKSNKFVLDEPAVLVSKLNPRIPRMWNVPSVPRPMAVASTEFVVLHPRRVSTSLLWAAMSQPSVSRDLAGLVAGTSGSHQRVKPSEMLSLNVPDVRELHPREQDEVESLCLHMEVAREESTLLARTRDELLPPLMSGKLRVQDAERRVEEVL